MLQWGQGSRIPHLTRSTLHRSFQRHGINRLARLDTAQTAKKKFKVYPIGYFYIDLTEVHTEQGKLYLFVAIDRTSKFAFVRLVEKANHRAAAYFLEQLVRTVPYKIHTVLTDNGTHLTTPGTSSPWPLKSNGPCIEVSCSAPTLSI